jgi:Cu2+-exporting ATPase
MTAEAASQVAPAAGRASEAGACAHCGLPVPPGRARAESEPVFCCAGCETVYEVIHGARLDGFYRVRQRTGSEPVPARTSGRRFAELDHPEALARHTEAAGPGLLRAELYLEGVHCAACVWLVERLPRVVPGVVEARLALRRSVVHVVWDATRTSFSAVALGLDRLGYTPHPVRGGDAQAARSREDRRALVRLGVAGAAAGNVMLLAVALYAGESSGMASPHEQLLRWASAAIGLFALVWPGAVFFRGAWAAMRTRTPHMDVPIALGLGTGGIAGAVNVARGVGDIYFDSLAVLVFLLLVGRWLQGRQQRRAADAVRLLFSLVPSVARRIRPGADGVDGAEVVEEVPVEAIVRGDVVEVAAGQPVPVDGEVVAGRSDVDASLLTGESRPIPAVEGEPIAAGTVNLTAPLRVRACATGADTRMGRLMELVEECTRGKAPIVRLADRISGWFVAVVTLLALGTFAAWSVFAPAHAVDHTVALLIVSCPCALGLATPLALVVAVGRAARRDVLIKGGGVVEALGRSRGTLLLDKTGTITEGRMALACWEGATWARRLVAALERDARHPVGRALAEAGVEPPGAGGDRRPAVGDVVLHPDGGVEGTVDGRRVLVGAPALLERQLGGLPPATLAAVERVARRALTPVVVAVDGAVEAVAGVGDRVRQDAREAVARLRGMGWRVGILTGDHEAVAHAVAREVGVETSRVHGGVTPEEKLARVERALAEGPVVMVGDGVNDAAALAAATVGVAVHGGAEASLAAADVYVGRPGLLPLVELAHASGRTLSVIRRCLVASLGYNALAVGLAAAGLINPLVAALLMPASSLTVISLAVGARTFAEGRS